MDLLTHLQSRGVRVELRRDHLYVHPSALLTDELRAAIKSSKPDLLRLTDRLIRAINRCCDARGDDAANRAALVLECTGLPAWEQRELIEHFNEQARIYSP